MIAGQADIAKSNLSNPPLRGRVGPAEEAAPAYSSVIGASTKESSENTIKNRAGRKDARNPNQNKDHFDSENDLKNQNQVLFDLLT